MFDRKITLINATWYFYLICEELVKEKNMYESVKLNMYYLAYLYFIYMIQKYVNAYFQVFGFRNALYYR